MAAIELTLSELLYNAVTATEVLTLSRDYFRLRKGLERRLYELARKHCGLQDQFVVGLEVLLKKLGAMCALKEFRRQIREMRRRTCFRTTRSNSMPPAIASYFERETAGSACGR